MTVYATFTGLTNGRTSMKQWASFFSFFCLGLLFYGEASAEVHSHLSQGSGTSLVKLPLDQIAVQACFLKETSSSHSGQGAWASCVEPHAIVSDPPIAVSQQSTYRTLFYSARNFEIRAGLSPPFLVL